MYEIDEMRQAEQEAEAFLASMEANDRAVQVFLSRAGQVHSAYAYALAQVRRELSALERAFQGAAASALGAFAGVLNSIRPALNGFAKTITSVFGVTYWKSSSSGMDAAAASLGRVARSTRAVAQAQKDLYSFDKITRVSARSGSGGGSSSGGGGGGSGSGGGEWVRIPGLIDEIAAKAKSVLSQLWRPIAQVWRQQGQQTIQAVLSALSAVGDAAAAVGQSWLKAWNSKAGREAVSTVLTIVEQLSRTVETLAARFQQAWTSAKLGDGIMKGILALVQTVLSTLSSMAAATAEWAKSVNFTPMLQAFATLLETLRPLAAVLGGALLTAYERVLLPIAGWTINEALPAMLNLLTNALNLLTAAINLLKPVATFLWNKILLPMGKWTGAGLIQGVQGASSGFRTLTGVLNKLPEGWSTLKSKTVEVWNSITGTLTGKAKSGSSGVTGAFQNMLKNAVAIVGNLRRNLVNIFKDLIEKAKKHLSALSGCISDPVKSGLNQIVSNANAIIRQLNKTLKLSWPSVTVNGTEVVKPGSAKLSNIPTMERLAEGGITTGPAFSLIGEAGREAVLPLERNTGWMDELARRLNRGQGQTVIQVQVGGETLVQKVVDGVNDITRRTGFCPIYV